MAIFEKNKGYTPIPKAPITQAAPLKSTHSEPAKSTFSQYEVDKKSKCVPTTSKVTYQEPNTSSSYSDSKSLGLGVLSTVANLLSKGPTISEAKISDDTRKQREKEMDLLRNRYKTPQSVHESSSGERPIPTAPPMPPTDFSRKSQQIEKAQVHPHKRRSGMILLSIR